MNSLVGSKDIKPVDPLEHLICNHFSIEKCRKVVLEKWFFKLGFFFLVNHFSLT